MGRSTDRDEPGVEDAVSMHTTQGDYTDVSPIEEGPPPSYTDTTSSEINYTPSTSAASAPMSPANLQPGFRPNFPQHHTSAGQFHPCDASFHPVIDPHKQSFFRVMGKPVNRYRTKYEMDPRYDNEPAFLEQAITEWAAKPPAPQVHIIGEHWQTVWDNNKKRREKVEDFNILLDMTPYIQTDFGRAAPWSQLRPVLNGTKTFRGSFRKTRASGYKRELEVGSAPDPSIKEWCHRYCASHATLKSFRLKRTVTGMDKLQLKTEIENLIRQTYYQGHITITFPVKHEYIDIYSNHWINRARQNPWVYWPVYITFLWILTWPFLFFFTSRYSVVDAEWPFSRLIGVAPGQVDDDIHRGRAKEYATMSEHEYVMMMKPLIQKLAREGWGAGSGGRNARYHHHRHGPTLNIRTGSLASDAAVGLLAAGMRGAFGRDQSQEERLGWGGDC